MSLKNKAAAFFAAALLGTSLSLPIHASAADSQKTDAYISHESGYYDTTQFVTIINGGSNDVYYTTDGSKPDTDSTLYEGRAIIVEENTVIRMAAYSEGTLVSSGKSSIKIRSAVPSASVDGGTYSNKVKVKLTCLDPAADIYYTTDGSAPTKDSNKYKKAITISETTTLKFASFSENLARSKVVTEKYAISEDQFEDPKAQAIFELVNETRAEYGLKPLKALPTLTEAAQVRAKEYSYCQSHYRPDGSRWDTVLSEYGVKRNTRTENLAYYYSTAKGAMKCWMSDSWHRGNILDPNAEYIGIGHYNNGWCDYWCQLFIGGE